jgi:putative YphP/YqiW family bacilliredoxin
VLNLKLSTYYFELLTQKEMYPEYLVAPMRTDLTSVGFEELKNAEEVANAINSEGTTFVVVNSVCGCAAANARPAAKIAVQEGKRPNKIVTVFAGMEKEAVDAARNHMLPYPPSSPSMALFKDGKLVHIIERHQIEGRPAQMIADNLIGAFDQFC